MGPLIDKHSVANYVHAIEKVKQAGGKVLFGGEVLEGEKYASGNYVMPSIAEVENHYEIVQE